MKIIREQTGYIWAIISIVLFIPLIIYIIYASLELNENNMQIKQLENTQKRQVCSSFSSCEEAEASYHEGNLGLDANHDGIPCNNLCKSNG